MDEEKGITARPSAKRARRHVGLMIAVIVAVAAIDQLVKAWILSIMGPGETIPIIGDWFRFFLVFNPGAAFSMGGEGSTWLFTTIQFAFVVGILIASPLIRARGEAVGLAMIAGGALGNLTDRLFREPGFWFGHVVDFISVGDFAVFNIADSSITVGVIVFIAAMFFDERATKTAKGEKR